MVLCVWLLTLLLRSVISHQFDLIHESENAGMNSNLRLELENFAGNISAAYVTKWYKNDQIQTETLLNGSMSYCLRDYLRIARAVISGESWPYKFIDASAKIPAGLTGGALTWSGSYELCKTIESTPSANESAIRGRYCTIRFPVTINDPDVAIDIGIQIGFCLPFDCSTDEMRKLVRAGKIDDRYSYCHLGPEEMASDKFFIFAVIILTILGILVLVGTLIDLGLYIKWKSTISYEPVDQFESLLFNEESSSVMASSSSVQSDEQGVSASTRPPETFSAYSDYRNDFYYKYACCGACLLVFSFPYNLYKFWNTKSPQIKDADGHWITHPLAALDGIRAITLSWIIYVHTLTFQVYYMSNALLFQDKQYKDWRFQLTRNGSFSVDTFFLISGLLSCYILIPNSEKCTGICAKIWFWLHYAVHRFLRIAPSWFVVTIAFTGLFPYMTDGPLYPQNPAAEDDLAACRDHWWVTFLNNWIHTDKPCMLWTWYLSNDYQFSVVLVPIFAALLAIHWIAGILFAVALVVSSSAATFVITYQYEYGPSPIPLKSMEHLYSAAYARWGSYAIGMILGWWLYYRPIKGTGRRFWVRCVTSTAASAAAAFLTLCCLFGLYGRLHTEVNPMSNLEASFYAALSRPVWSIGIAICIYLCAADWSSAVNALLTFAGFRVLARLTYCAYLIHPIIIMYYGFSRSEAAHMDNTFLFFTFLAVWLLSQLMALIISMCTEVPVIVMENTLRRKRSRQGAEDAK
ncbi:acyltransferase [Opisthorchis viverrini]|uniref:Acyltransferase n=1 Tax=Opisthorchis viverrini TaxID=6198 RepID=A0A1S8X2A6_OPIVI|nr:acyltransferase [Opisthorchis viverrini]